MCSDGEIRKSPFDLSCPDPAMCRSCVSRNGCSLDANSYNTRSNKVRIVKTPGGKLQYQHTKKKGSPPKCGDCGIKLPGVSPPLRS